MVRFELSSGDEWMDGRADLWAVFPFFFSSSAGKTAGCAWCVFLPLPLCVCLSDELMMEK